MNEDFDQYYNYDNFESLKNYDYAEENDESAYQIEENEKNKAKVLLTLKSLGALTIIAFICFCWMCVPIFKFLFYIVLFCLGDFGSKVNRSITKLRNNWKDLEVGASCSQCFALCLFPILMPCVGLHLLWIRLWRHQHEAGEDAGYYLAIKDFNKLKITPMSYEEFLERKQISQTFAKRYNLKKLLIYLLKKYNVFYSTNKRPRLFMTIFGKVQTSLETDVEFGQSSTDSLV